ncbi:MAG: hypothetical protein K6F58_03200 [Bacteroidales bacterium]|nr:hypothetical protein [Bacteroidales bacterium]
MKSLPLKILLLSLALSATVPAAAQFTASGTEAAKVKWEHFYSPNYHLIFPEGLDSLARVYAASLERWRIPNSVTSGFLANQYYKTPMPAVLHSFTGYSNGSVSWAPRNLSLYTNPECYNPDPQDWVEQLAVHEGRHISQMQFGACPRKASFELFNYLTGELFPGAMAAVYSGPTFLEGDAVAAETALTDAGRGRTADFLQYYRVCFADSLWRDYWKWSLGSQRWYTPDYYRAGYMLHAGMRNTFGRPDFTKYYYQRVLRKTLFPIGNLQKSVKEVSGLKFRKAFRRIEEDFAADWAANDSLRLELAGGFQEGQALTEQTKYFRTYNGLTMLGDSLYAVRKGLDLVPQLVRIDTDGTVTPLCYMAGTTSRLAADERTGLIYWTELVSDLRWEKKSSSRLYGFDPKSGKKQLLSDIDYRWYNPAVSPSDTLVAVVSTVLDGQGELVVVNGRNGAIRQILQAPEALQLVEPAWIGDKLYASAIGPDGFGIYAADGWKELLPQRIVKINRLFGHDGRLWFTSDRDGTAELHSLGTDGTLRQETNLRFGGGDWCFAGDSLFFTALSVNEKGIRSLPAAQLLGLPVSPDPLPRPIPDNLSYQEDTLAAALALSWKDAPAEEPEFSETRPYSKAGHLFKVHSWAPVYVSEDAVSALSFEDVATESSLGATVFFQNDLESSYGQAGLCILGPDYPSLNLKWTYAGWLPVIELDATVGGRQSLMQAYTITTSGDSVSLAPRTDTLSRPRLSGSARVYIPFNLSSGGWTRGIVPSFTIAASNDVTPAGLDFSSGIAMKYFTPLVLKGAVRGYTMLPTPPSGIFPKLGAGMEVGMLSRPLHREWTSSTAYVSAYGYLPGLARTHGLAVSGGWYKDVGEGMVNDLLVSMAAEYALPFAPVDWSFLSPVTYVRNFELRLCGTYEYTQSVMKYGGTTDNVEIYVGGALLARLGNIAWAPYPARIGVKYLYNPIHPELSGMSMVFTVDN